MVEWRWLRGWSEAELEARLGEVDRERLNFVDRPEEMIPELGWNHVRSYALVGREAPGPPDPRGAYARARLAVEFMEFSDPRIVVPHFDRDTPLEERVMLLELRPPGPRFLCPARVGRVRDESNELCTTFGFSFETLDGHVEKGREWFLLTKDHASGEIRFRIAAAWRAGQFPNAWSWLGFQLLGRRYQRAWHRLAHIRLRHVIAEGPLHAPEGRHLMHGGSDLFTAPVQFHAARAHPPFRRLIEREDEAVRRDRFLLTAGFGWLAGMRSTAPFAFLSHALAKERAHLRTRDPLVQAVARPVAARASKFLAAGEFLADKSSVIPNRTSALPLIGRAISGAVAGYGLAARGERSRVGASALGAAVAVVSTFATFELRKRLGQVMPKTAAALLEDAAVLLAGVVLAKRLRTPRHTEVGLV